MQIFVRSTTYTLTVVAEPTDTVASLKAKVHAREGIPLDQWRLSFGGRPLIDERATLADYGIIDESTLWLCLHLLGGGKKRKKKTFTTPKKGKHEHRNAGLDAVLGRYRVDEAKGEVERLRKECPNTECAPGVFMAAHDGRHACGRCGLTYVVEDQSIVV